MYLENGVECYMMNYNYEGTSHSVIETVSRFLSGGPEGTYGKNLDNRGPRRDLSQCRHNNNLTVFIFEQYSFENVTHLRYLGTAITNQNLIQEEIKEIEFG
jgi:hypothetical protein